MDISTRERNIVVLAAIVALIFAINTGLPALRGIYQQRAENIEGVLLDITREQRLIEAMADWRDQRIEVEVKAQQLEAQIFTGDTVPIIAANIQRVISGYAREAGISVNSTRLADRLDTDGWLLISQEVSFRTSEQANSIAFLEKLETSAPRLWVTDYNFSASRSQYSGSITVVGFARSQGLELADSDSRQ